MVKTAGLGDPRRLQVDHFFDFLSVKWIVCHTVSAAQSLQVIKLSDAYDGMLIGVGRPTLDTSIQDPDEGGEFWGMFALCGSMSYVDVGPDDRHEWPGMERYKEGDVLRLLLDMTDRRDANRQKERQVAWCPDVWVTNR